MFPTTGGLTTWTSSYLNLVPFRSVMIHCPELADHHYSSPSSYSSHIVRKVLIDAQLGGVVNDTNSAFHEDYIDVSNRNLKRLSFRITDTKTKQSTYMISIVSFHWYLVTRPINLNHKSQPQY